jgi:hypothetical protein
VGLAFETGEVRLKRGARGACDWRHGRDAEVVEYFSGNTGVRDEREYLAAQGNRIKSDVLSDG